MSVGAGILLAVLAILAAWQLEKRHAWKKAALWMSGTLALAAIVIGGWIGWENYSSSVQQRDEIAQAQRPDTFAYWEIKMNMSANEVRYLKGEPTSRRAREGVGKPEAWNYADALDSAYDIYFDDRNRVQAVICQGGEFYGCEHIADVGITTTESELVERLGAPTSEDPPNERGTKSVRYQGAQNSLMFFLEKARVSAIVFARNDREGRLRKRSESEEPSK